MNIKDFRAQVKAAGDDLGEGEFEAIVSVFGNEDSVGDVVMPGAFSKSLAEWTAKGDPIPVVWSHDWGNPFSHVGHVTEAKETERGLWVKGVMDLDNPTAAQVHRLMKGRRVTQFSFAYDVEDGGWGERDGREVYEIRQAKVYEVGPTLVGANQATELLAAKAAVLADGAKAGRVLSQKNYDQLVQARDAINAVIDAAEPAKTSDAPASGDSEQKTGQVPGSPADDEPTGAKSDQAGPSPARVRVLADIEYAAI